MGGGYAVAQPDAIGQLIGRITSLESQVRELQRPDGSQLADAVATLTQLVNDLPGQITAAIGTSLTTAAVHVTGNSQVDGNETVNGRLTLTNDTIYSTYALNNAVTSGYFALYVNDDGRFGRSPSARKYKQDIASFSPSAQAVFALTLREFRLKAAVEEYGDAAAVEHGLIAEELVDIGLGWLVLFGPDGEPESIAYEKVALALIPAIQDHERRLTAAGL